MPRHQIKRRVLNPDPTYNDVAVEALVNQVMHDGKKTTARKVVYGAFDIVKERSNQDAVEVFQKAVENIAPLLEVKSKRVGGATYQVPREVPAHRRTSLALRWILQAARSKSGRPMKERLADEILAAAKGEGDAFKKKEDTHRMAEANRAFAHFGW